jgi:hypothetical protein
MPHAGRTAKWCTVRGYSIEPNGTTWILYRKDDGNTGACGVLRWAAGTLGEDEARGVARLIN